MKARIGHCTDEFARHGPALEDKPMRAAPAEGNAVRRRCRHAQRLGGAVKTMSIVSNAFLLQKSFSSMKQKRERNFIFAVDLDGVVVDYYKAIRPIAAEWLNKSVDDLTPNFSYGFKEWGLPADGELGYNYMHRWAVRQKDIFLTADPIPNAAYTLRRLSEARVHIRIITHRLYVGGLHEKVVGQTVQWLEKHHIPYSDLCFLKEKVSLGADLYIDDSPSNIKAYEKSGKDYLIFENCTNLGLAGPRAKNWDEVYDYVLSKMKAKRRQLRSIGRLNRKSPEPSQARAS